MKDFFFEAMRAQLRYMKKSVGYRGGCYSPYENQRDIIDCEKEIKRLCKLRDAAKAMEKKWQVIGC